MCVTFCHRCSVLYFNHDDCSPQLCPVGATISGSCADCRHRQGDLCGLTRALLPAAGGCCHYSVTLVTEPQIVTSAMCDLLGMGANETVADLLLGLDAPFETDADGQIWIDPNKLGLPETYGLGTD